MISPTDVSVYSLRREELLVECDRVRLIAQGYPPVNLPRETRAPSLTLVVLSALVAIAGWITSLS